MTIEFRSKSCKSIITNSNFYSIADRRINKCSVFRDLGLYVDTHLTFETHVQHIRLKCHRLIGLCFRLFALRDLSAYLMFWKVYVVPIIMYCIPLFGLVSISNINNIERIQRYFTRRLFYRLFPTALSNAFASVSSCPIGSAHVKSRSYFFLQNYSWYLLAH